MRSIGRSTTGGVRRQCRVTPPLTDSQLMNPSGGIVLNALLGSSTMPRGATVWSQHHILSSQAVRDDPNHLLNHSNSAVRNLLVDALNERQRFQPSERRLLWQRSQSSASMISSTDDVAHSADVGSAPVSQWFSIGVHRLSQRGAPLAQRWDDFLFPLLQHQVFSSSDVKQISAALESITSLVQWQVDRLLEQEADGAVRDETQRLMLVSPRWARKLRKVLIEHGPKGSVMTFANWFITLRNAESRYGCTMLTADIELLQFLATIPCRKDSGLPRPLIATETARMMDYTCSSLWSLQSTGDLPTEGGGIMESLTRCLTQSGNAIAFSQNDGREAERLRAIFVAGAVQTLSFDTTSVSAELVHIVLQTAVLAIRRKCSALQYTTSRSFAVTLCEMMTAQSWMDDQVDQRGAPNINISDFLSMLDGLSSQVALSTSPSALSSIVNQLATFLAEMGSSIRAPDVFDRLVRDIEQTVDPLLAPVELSCGRIRALVDAAGNAAPQGSLWATRRTAMSAESTWRCGCGEEVTLSTKTCTRCTFAANTTATPEGQFQCNECHAVSPVKGAGNCTSCNADHPIIAAALSCGQWHCQSCATTMPALTPACPSCAASNPLHACVCTSCHHRNSNIAQACSLCGTALQGTALPIRMQLCSTCAGPAEIPPGKDHLDACLKCKRTTTTAAEMPLPVVVTRHFQWQCGCGSWNSPLDRRCHACCPLSSRGGVSSNATTTLYTCPSCTTPCGQRDVQLNELEAVPHLLNGPLMKVASCGGCGAWHPRDASLLMTPRLTSCPSCEMVQSVDSSAHECSHCKLPLDERSVRASSFVDLPWVCHSCSAANATSTTNTSSQESESLSYCAQCHAERPSPLLFSPNAPWACAQCSTTNRGYGCSTCGVVNPHLPKSEVMLWQCTKGGCGEWNHSWDAACGGCTTSRHADAVRAAAVDWTCQRCKSVNGSLGAHCWGCKAAAPMVTWTPIHAEESLHDTKSLLLRAAEEAGGSLQAPLNVSWVEVGVGAHLELPGLLEGGDLTDMDDILSKLQFL